MSSTRRPLNGVNVDALRETIVAVRERPGVAAFRFRVANRWIDGARNRTRIHRFHGAGQDRAHAREFVVESDLPPIALGTDRAPTPVEYVLAALAACVTTSLVHHASARGLRLDSVEADVEADLDLHEFLGLTERSRAGEAELQVRMRVGTDATDEQLLELVRLARDCSPLVSLLGHPAPVRVEAIRCRTPQPERP